MPVKHLIHKHLRFLDARPATEDTSNTLVGSKSNGKIVTDSSVKIDGSGFKRRVHPGIHSQNRETLSKLVKTVF